MTTHRWARGVVGGLLLAASAVPGWAQGARAATAPPLPPGTSLTQQILLATYPELRDRAISWRIERRGAAVVLEAREAVPPPLVARGTPEGPEATARAAASAPALDPPLVTAVAEVDPEGALLALRVDGVLPRPAALVAARAAAAPLEALRALDAAFAPDVASADQLMPPRLAEALQASGAPVGQFRTHGDDVVEPLSWVVEVDAMGADGTPRTYMVTFEPVEGRLLAVVRR